MPLQKQTYGRIWMRTISTERYPYMRLRCVYIMFSHYRRAIYDHATPLHTKYRKEKSVICNNTVRAVQSQGLYRARGDCQHSCAADFYFWGMKLHYQTNVMMRSVPTHQNTLKYTHIKQLSQTTTNNLIILSSERRNGYKIIRQRYKKLSSSSTRK